MYIILLFIIMFSNPGILYTQSTDKLTTLNLSLFFTQSMNDNWKMGKYEALELSSTNEIVIKFKLTDIFEISSRNKVAIGCKYEYFENTKNSVILPTDNLLQTETTIKYIIGWKIDPYISFNLNSQITESFRKMQNTKIPTSNFRDPITTQEGIGFASRLIYDKNTRIDVSFGATTKQIRAERYTLLTDNKQTKVIERYKTENGVQLKVDISHKFSGEITYNGKFDTTLNFHRVNLWQCNSDNEIKIQLWKIFGILIKIELNYNEQISKKVQYKQSTKFGIITSI